MLAHEKSPGQTGRFLVFILFTLVLQPGLQTGIGKGSVDDLAIRTRVERELSRGEATIGYPVDIECSYARGELYLLQCRPVTTTPGRRE